MEVDALIKKIESEKKQAQDSIHSDEGLLRLQEVAAQYDGEYKLHASEDIVEDLKNKPKPEGYKTGIEKLDNLTGGFRQKQVISMFAHTKHGKTECAMWMMSLFPELEPVLIPLEQDAEELLSQKLERGHEIPHFLAPRRSETFVLTDWIEQRIVEGIAKYNSKMIVIDHLGYIDNNGKDGQWKRENLAYRIGQVMKEIKHLAKKWDVCVILLIHISKEDEGNPPQLKDISNSSDVAKESDTVISIWRKNSLKGKIRIHENKTMLSVVASRRFGKNGSVGLTYDDVSGKYHEDNKWVEQMQELAQQEIDADDAF